MNLTYVFQTEHYAAFSPLIVLYFFLAGLSAGLFLLSSLSPVFGLKHFKPLAKPSCAMALATLIPGLLALIFDLGQPLRALTLFFRVNPHSVMSWGSFILLIYGIVCLIYAHFLWRENDKVKVWGKAGVIFAMALGLYTGFLLAVVPGRPLWNSALLPILFLISGWVAALSLISLLQGFLPKALQLEGGDAKDALHGMKVWMVVLEILLIAFHFISVLTLNGAGRAVIMNLLSGTKAFSFVIVQVVLGMVLPLAVVLISKGSVKALGMSGLLSLIGVFALRYNFIFGGEELPNAGTLLFRFEGSAWISVTVLLVLTVVLVLIMPRFLGNLMKGKTTTQIRESF